MPGAWHPRLFVRIWSAPSTLGCALSLSDGASNVRECAALTMVGRLGFPVHDLHRVRTNPRPARARRPGAGDSPACRWHRRYRSVGLFPTSRAAATKDPRPWRLVGQLFISRARSPSHSYSATSDRQPYGGCTTNSAPTCSPWQLDYINALGDYKQLCAKTAELRRQASLKPRGNGTPEPSSCARRKPCRSTPSSTVRL